MGLIYCLYDTEKFTPRYIGQTKQDANERYWQHWHDALDGNHRKVYRWMRSVFLSGFDIDIHILEGGIDPSNLNRRETHWIQFLPNILNDRMNWWTSGTKESAQKISDKCRLGCQGIIENVNGWHGIQYHKSEDAYTVRIYYGLVDGPCCVDWLKEGGDELAGALGTSSRWFTDLALAIEARDKKRNELRGIVDSIRGPEWQWPTDKID